MVKKITLLGLLVILLSPVLALGEFQDNGDTLTDTNTGLMWLKATSDSEMTWEDALSHCEALTDAGYDDWRLPNRIELQSILDYSKTDSMMDAKFTNPQSDYWTSTTYVKGDTVTYSWYAWYVNATDGTIAKKKKTDLAYVLAVRGGQNEVSGNIVISIPQQNSTWSVGRVMPIIWDAGGSKADVQILLSKDAGQTFDKVIVDATENDGSYVWWKIDVGQDTGDNYVIKVEPTDDKEKDKASTQGLFSIQEGGDIAGDMNNDKKFNLKDIIMGLQTLTTSSSGK